MSQCHWVPICCVVCGTVMCNNLQMFDGAVTAWCNEVICVYCFAATLLTSNKPAAKPQQQPTHTSIVEMLVGFIIIVFADSPRQVCQKTKRVDDIDWSMHAQRKCTVWASWSPHQPCVCLQNATADIFSCWSRWCWLCFPTGLAQHMFCEKCCLTLSCYQALWWRGMPD